MRRVGAFFILITFFLSLLFPSSLFAASTISVTDIKNANGTSDVTGGSLVIIDGSGFGAFGNDCQVTFEFNTVSMNVYRIQTWSDTQITVRAPYYTLGTQETEQVLAVTITTDDGRTYTYTQKKLTYVHDPFITNVYPYNLITVSGFDQNGRPIIQSTVKRVAVEGAYLKKVSKIRVSAAVSGNSILYSNLDEDKKEPGYAGGISWDSEGAIYVAWNSLMENNDLIFTAESTAGGLSNAYEGAQGEMRLSNIGIPEATSFNPSPSALIRGIDIAITGSNFESTPANNVVIIAGGEATVKTVEQVGMGKKIVVTVPSSADKTQHDLRFKIKDPATGKVKSGAIYAGAVNILPTPGELEILGVVPNVGTPAGGTEIMVIGRGFNTDTEVLFSSANPKWEGLGANPRLLSSEELPAGYPEDAVVLKVLTPRSPNNGYYTGPVDVTVRDKNLPDIVKDTLTNGFYYSTQGQALRLTAIMPISGPEEGGQTVTLTGRSFFRFRSSDPVTSLRYANGRLISADYNSNPYVISGFEPASDNNLVITEKMNSYLEYTDVVVYRTISVTIGGTPVKITKVTELIQADGQRVQYLEGTTNAHYLDPLVLGETVDVVVTVTEEMFTGGQRLVIPEDPAVAERAVLSKSYTYQRVKSVPEITSITPTKGPTAGGTQVEIEGFDLYQGLSVFFGETKGTIVDIVPGGVEDGRPKSKVSVLAPAHAKRERVDVRVVNWDGGEDVLEEGFEYISSPAITKVSPAVSSPAGGVFVTVEGKDFMYGSAVKIGNNVVIGHVYEDETENQRFYTDLIDSLFPGENVTFFDELEIRVMRDAVELAPYDRANGNRIYLEVPPGEPKEQDFWVINPDGGIALWQNKFQYLESSTQLAPRINTITPNEGNIQGGEVVTINGSNFRDGALVTFDGQLASAITVSQAGQTITCRTPPGTRSDVWVPVQVINVSANGIGVATVAQGFRYHAVYTNPTINRFAPTHGTKGTKVVVEGADFVVGAETRVFLGDQLLTAVTSWNSDQQVMGAVYVKSPELIEFIVPELPSPGEYAIKVINPDTAQAIAAKPFVYQLPTSNPTIEDIDGDQKAVNPERGSVYGGTDIVVEGADFREGLELYVGTQLASEVKLELVHFDSGAGIWSKCRVRAKTPALPAGQTPGPADIMIVNPDGGTARALGAFTYVTPSSSPVITAVQPNKGPAAGTQEVIIRGRDFRVNRDENNVITDWPVVTFGGIEATVVKDDTLSKSQGTQLKVITPLYSGGGAVDVTITNPDTGTYTLKKGFTFEVSKPTISSVNPSKFPKSRPSLATITGSGFVVPSEAEGVKWAGSDVLLSDATGQTFTSLADVTPTGKTTIDGAEYPNIEVLDASRIRVVIPPLSTGQFIGKRVLRVRNPDGGQADCTVEYVSPVVEPTISSIEPSQGSANGGTNVTITGTNFRDQVEVYFGTGQATIIEKSENRLVVRTPAYSMPANQTTAAVDVSVINTADQGTAVKPSGFTYVSPELQPTITSITPDHGTTLGGTIVVIKGDNFRTGCRVFFGTLEAASVTYDRYDQLTVVTPSHAKGSVDVSVRNPAPDYGEALKANGFTFEETVAPPPSDFDGELWNRRAIKLFWSASSVPSSYEIYVNTRSSTNSKQFLVSTDKTEFVFEDIEPGKRYYFWMRTFNQYGCSDFIACKSNPIYVSDDDVENRPQTAEILQNTTRISREKDDMVIIVGDEISSWSSSYYDVTLDSEQAALKRLRLMIPLVGVRTNPDVTLRINGDRINLSVPLKVLKTSEMQDFWSRTGEGYAFIYIYPTSTAVLESVKANRSGSRPLDGFAVEIGFEAKTRKVQASTLAGSLRVVWQVEGGVGRPTRAEYYSYPRLEWVNCTDGASSLTGRIEVRVPQPNLFIIFG